MCALALAPYIGIFVGIICQQISNYAKEQQKYYYLFTTQGWALPYDTARDQLHSLRTIIMEIFFLRHIIG